MDCPSLKVMTKNNSTAGQLRSAKRPGEQLCGLVLLNAAVEFANKEGVGDSGVDRAPKTPASCIFEKTVLVRVEQVLNELRWVVSGHITGQT